MIRNVSIKLNGVETGADTDLTLTKLGKHGVLVEWENDKEIMDIDLGNDQHNEYDIFIDIVSNENLDDEAKLYKEKFEYMRAEFIKLQKLYLNMLYKDIDNFKVD